MTRFPEGDPAEELTREESYLKLFNDSFIAKHLATLTKQMARILIVNDPDPYDSHDLEEFATYYAKFATALLERGVKLP